METYDTGSIDSARNESGGDGFDKDSSSSDSGDKDSNSNWERSKYDDCERGRKNPILDANYGNDDEAERVLSQSLLNLSLFDRNAILEEIHGVRCLAIKETPELIQRSLKEFQKELNKNKDYSGFSKNKAYHLIRKCREQEIRACNDEYNYNYAMDDDNFRLRFLRCEFFNVEKAVLRFYNYLDYAYDMYGEVTLQRQIRFADFNKADLKLFRKGFFQFLPFRDSSGRRVLIVIGGMGPHEDAPSRVGV